MTVKEAVSVLTDAKTFFISWNEGLRAFDPTDDLMMDAYGDYRVKRICNAGGTEESAYEIAITSIPVKEAQA